MKALLLDLDGTLIRYSRNYASFLDELVEAFGVTDRDGFLEIYGREILKEGHITFRGCVAQALKSIGARTPEQFGARIASCVEGYAAGISLLPHAMTLLNAHASLPKALVSNGPSDMQRAALRAAGIEGHFQAIVISGDEDVRVRKPNPEIFHIACRRLNCQPEDALMIGDNQEADIDGALAAGVRAIHISAWEAGKG